MAKDIRVIVVKLADRLHNMRTLEALPEHKQERISKETLSLYAPIAHKLGMFRIKAELEDKSFYYINKNKYNEIKELLEGNKQERNFLIDFMKYEISYLLEENDIFDFKIKGRVKNIYSINKKIEKNEKDFEDLYDIYALRVVVHSIEECYQALGLIHSNFKPIPKRFKDYISVPKPNMYQSLHTTIVGEQGNVFEIQIRTYEMDDVAEKGIAAHWAYKEGTKSSKNQEQTEIANALRWYGDLLELAQTDTSSPVNFVNTIKEELFDDTIYVFTPTSNAISLPKDATPVDFAYKIHTNIGDTTKGAIVNNKLVPLSTSLKNGDIVKINTSKASGGPKKSWLDFVKTSNAKNKIRRYLNNQNKEYLFGIGESNLERAFKHARIDFIITDDLIKEHYSHLSSVDDLYIEVGKGVIKPNSVVNKVIGENEVTEPTNYISRHRNISKETKASIIVEGIDKPKLRIANCCTPLPGEEITGYVSKGAGIIIHSKSCKNIQSFNKDRLIEVRWADKQKDRFETNIRIEAQDRKDVLSDVLKVLSDNDLLISGVTATTTKEQIAIIKLKVLTSDIVKLNTVINKLESGKNIYTVERRK